MPKEVSGGGRPRILVVVGTRPEAIKMAPVLAALRPLHGLVETRLALTGQHTDMVDQALEVFRLIPDYDLEIMREGQDLYDVAHRCLDGLRGVVRDFGPELILVQGDTGSVFYASLVAFLEGVAVGHVEAGLRSGNKGAPWPEEMFRRLSDSLSDLYFAPTFRARENLLAEGAPPEGIHVTGNTVVDALLSVVQKCGDPSNPVLGKIVEEGRSMVLLTAHRRESFGEPLREVFSAVREMAARAPEVEILYPVHPNPNVKEPATELLSGHPRIHLTDPLHYLDLVLALRHASLVLTDSGGIQEEAPTFGTPVLVLREVTERPEGVEAGVATLVGTRSERILQEGLARLEAKEGVDPSVQPPNPYGDGKAGTRIADIVVETLTGRPRETRDWDGT
jgi:UDP-N-acetylglucosamine 2-epimerase (non-hydrolysing)